MQGIDLNKPIRYKTASLRFFKEGEHHISRRCPEDVLLLVYDGVLRFSEDGVPFEISAGQYYMHEAPNTLEALKRVILPVLEQRGYACVTVSEILEAKGATNLPDNYSIRDAYLAKTDEEVAVNMQKYR